MASSRNASGRTGVVCSASSSRTISTCGQSAKVRLRCVTDANAVPRRAAEAGHVRVLETVFGEVSVSRIAYRRQKGANLYPSDGTLNLPEERHSHGLRRLAAVEATRGSFDAAVDAIGRASGQRLGKRQVEGLALRAADDFESFCQRPQGPSVRTGRRARPLGRREGDRHEERRPPAGRLEEGGGVIIGEARDRGSRREKSGTASAWRPSGRSTTAMPRAAHPGRRARKEAGKDQAPGPVARTKWLVASVTEDAASVHGRHVFEEARRPRAPNTCGPGWH